MQESLSCAFQSDAPQIEDDAVVRNGERSAGVLLNHQDGVAALGFLGLGVSPPTPEWGAMISSDKDNLALGVWWPSTFPGIAISLATLGFVMLGDGLRDILDPRLRA